MKRRTWFEQANNTRGTVTVVVALLMLVFIGFMAFAIDVGYMMINRNDLQNVADGAALAATRQLGSIYTGMSYSAQQAYVGNAAARAAIVPVAQEVASKNYVKDDAGNTIIIDEGDVALGVWSAVTGSFYSGFDPPNAVKVTVRRDAGEHGNGSVATFLAGVLGIRSVNVSATATASLTNLLKTPEGGLPVPVGISKAYFKDPAEYCDSTIQLYPTNSPEGCAGWHVYDQDPSSAEVLRETIRKLTEGTYPTPETISGTTQFDFSGGNIANVLCSPNEGTDKGSDKASLKKLFDAMKVKNDGVIDKDEDENTWTTSVPVYDSSDCSNPNGDLLIVGFATIVITNVQCPPAEQIITAQVICDNIDEGPGGGVNYGTFGSIPNLVQ